MLWPLIISYAIFHRVHASLPKSPLVWGNKMPCKCFWICKFQHFFTDVLLIQQASVFSKFMMSSNKYCPIVRTQVLLAPLYNKPLKSSNKGVWHEIADRLRWTALTAANENGDMAFHLNFAPWGSLFHIKRSCIIHTTIQKWPFQFYSWCQKLTH